MEKAGLCLVSGLALLPVVRQSHPQSLDQLPPVSYTHLDVYKRQDVHRGRRTGATAFAIERNRPRLVWRSQGRAGPD